MIILELFIYAVLVRYLNVQYNYIKSLKLYEIEID